MRQESPVAAESSIMHSPIEAKETGFKRSSSRACRELSLSATRLARLLRRPRLRQKYVVDRHLQGGDEPVRLARHPDDRDQLHELRLAHAFGARGCGVRGDAI